MSDVLDIYVGETQCYKGNECQPLPLHQKVSIPPGPMCARPPVLTTTSSSSPPPSAFPSSSSTAEFEMKRFAARSIASHVSTCSSSSYPFLRRLGASTSQSASRPALEAASAATAPAAAARTSSERSFGGIPDTGLRMARSEAFPASSRKSLISSSPSRDAQQCWRARAMPMRRSSDRAVSCSASAGRRPEPFAASSCRPSGTRVTFMSTFATWSCSSSVEPIMRCTSRVRCKPSSRALPCCNRALAPSSVRVRLASMLTHRPHCRSRIASMALVTAPSFINLP
mmetsp:Transcript_28448/g.92923  ORF Transcript_28448/g.92923 Transcript_28448/m.92923 type:complete len:284 (+) Transcript_28448:988-1839(+)